MKRKNKRFKKRNSNSLSKLSSKKMNKIIQLSKSRQFKKFSKVLQIFLFGCESGNKVFKMEHKDIIAVVFFLSLKYKGEIGLTSSVLK